MKRMFDRGLVALTTGLFSLGAWGQTLDGATRTFTSGEYKLTLRQLAANQFGVRLTSTASSAVDITQDQPAQLVIKNGTTPTDRSAPYSSVTVAGNTLVAKATLTTAAGSQFGVEDTYSAEPAPGAFVVSRKVSVLTANSGDQGFASRYAVGPTVVRTLGAYDMFAPGVWYGTNSQVATDALASNPNDTYFYIRESRLGLPLIMMQDRSSGVVLSLAHVDQRSSSGIDETNTAWVVDSTIRYASVGAHKTPSPQLAVMYPASEGEITYLYASPNRHNWVRRSHPVTPGVVHEYKVMIKLDRQNGFNAALSATWSYFVDRFNTAIANVPLDQIYRNGINLLSTVTDNYGGGGLGLPFQVQMDGTFTNGDISYVMGFVGQQIPAGYQMLRAGLKGNDATLAAKGEGIIDLWAGIAADGSGLPRVWYDVFPPAFRTTETSFLRTASDGMEGVIAGARLMRQQNRPKVAWEQFARGYGDWLVAQQNSDGSWYRAYNPGTGAVTRDGKTATTNPIRFLVQLFFFTGDIRYRDSALHAGQYAWNTVYVPGAYVGGAVDNPNVIDKEAGIQALHAFLSLYDMTRDATWLDAARAAAYYSESWVYNWDFQLNTPSPIFRDHGTSGQSLIATGHSGADAYMAYGVADYYRLYLLTGDAHLLKAAKLLAYNTKVTTDYANTYGYRYRGLLREAITMADFGYTGIQTWLPWLTIAQVEPLADLEDRFGTYDLAAIEAQPLSTRQARSQANIFGGPYAISGGATYVSNSGFESPGRVTNVIPGWSIWTPDNGASATSAYTEDSQLSHGGRFHLTLFKSTPFSLSAFKDMTLPNGTYKVTAWVQSSGGMNDTHMEVHNFDAPDRFLKATIPGGGSGYTQVSLTVPVTIGKLTLGFYADDRTGGHWTRVDDVSVQAVSTVMP